MCLFFVDLVHSTLSSERKMKCVLLAAFTVALFSTSSLAQEFTVDKDAAAYNAPDYSPFVDQHYPNRVFWATRISTRRIRRTRGWSPTVLVQPKSAPYRTGHDEAADSCDSPRLV